MRKAALAVSIVLLAAAWAVAQTYSGQTTPATQENMSRQESTIDGCLQGSRGTYVITDNAGNTYQLAGNAEQLSTYVGETVRVTGAITDMPMAPGAIQSDTSGQAAGVPSGTPQEGVGTNTTGTSIGDSPTLTVTDLHRVAKTCNTR